MKTKLNTLSVSIPVAILLFVLCLLVRPIDVFAQDTLSGKLSINYSETTGSFKAVYDGDQTLSSAAVYTWYKDGSTIGTGSSYSPNAAGTYYCILKDTNEYEGTLTSTSITLYRATGGNMIFDNNYGLYKVGDTVNVTAQLYDSQTVANWKVSAAGIEIPETGQSVSFRMPAQNVTVTATIKTAYDVKVYGGTADKYKAYTGETITITASDIAGKEFVSWSATGGRLGDAYSKTTTLTMASSSVSVTANFNGVVSSNNDTNNNNGKADALNAVYTVLDAQGHSVQFYHHTQGPLCDAAFKYAQGNDWLVTDYFNLTVDNSFATYELPTPIKIQVTIPDDLIAVNRHWRMVCVSKNGAIYSFEDEDANDSTITFSPNRFYAYAMCYNDIMPSYEEEIIIDETPVESVIDMGPTSTIHSADESQTTSSTIHSVDASSTTNANGVATTATPEGTKLKSNQSSAVERASGASVSLISM